MSVQCYTFGAPRTGNHAFARLYNAAVPDTWHVINNNDVVTSGGKVCGVAWWLWRDGASSMSQPPGVAAQSLTKSCSLDCMLAAVLGAVQAARPPRAHQ